MGKRSRNKRRTRLASAADQAEPSGDAVPAPELPAVDSPALEKTVEIKETETFPEPQKNPIPIVTSGWTATIMLILAAWLLGMFVRLYWVEEGLRPERANEYLQHDQFLPNTHDSYYFGAIIQKAHLGMHANNTRVPDHYREGIITLLPVAVLDYFNAPVFQQLTLAVEQMETAIDDFDELAAEARASSADEVSQLADVHAKELRAGLEKLRSPLPNPKQLRETAVNAAELVRQKAQELRNLQEKAKIANLNKNALTRAGPALKAAQNHAAQAGRLPFLSVENVMLYFPAVFGALLTVPLVLIGRLYGSVLWGFLAALIGVTAHSYYNRTLAGYFDTDMFSVTLPAIIVYFLLHSILRKSLITATIGALALFIFPLFYKSSLPIIYSVGFCYMGWQLFIRHREPTAWPSIIPIGLAMIFAPSSWGGPFSADPDGWLLKLLAIIGAGLIMKLVPFFRATQVKGGAQSWKPHLPSGIAAVLIVLATLYFTNPFQTIVSRVTQYSSAASATETAKTGSVELNFRKVITTVQEAQRGLSAKQVAWRASGSTLACLLAILGYALLIARHPEFLITVPLVGIGFYTFMGGLRFTIHAVGIAGLSLGYLFFYNGTSRLGRTVIAGIAGGLVGGLLWYWLGKSIGASSGIVDIMLILPGLFAGYATIHYGVDEDSNNSTRFQISCLAVFGALVGIIVGKLVMAELNKNALRASFDLFAILNTFIAMSLAAISPWLDSLSKMSHANNFNTNTLSRLKNQLRIPAFCMAVAIIGGLALGWMSHESLDGMYTKISNSKVSDQDSDLTGRQREAFERLEKIYVEQRGIWFKELLVSKLTRAELGNVLKYVTSINPADRRLRQGEMAAVLAEAADNDRFRNLFSNGETEVQGRRGRVIPVSASSEMQAAATKPIGGSYVILGLLIGLFAVLGGTAKSTVSRNATAVIAGGACIFGLIIGGTTQTGFIGIDVIGSFRGLSFLWVLMAIGLAAMLPLTLRRPSISLAKPCITALTAAVAGGALWYLVARITGQQIHFLFWPLGAMAGWIIARTIRSDSTAMPFIAGAAAFFTILLGKFIWFDIASGRGGNTLGGLAQGFPGNFHLIWMWPAVATAALMPMLLSKNRKYPEAWASLGGVLGAVAGGIGCACIAQANPKYFPFCLLLAGALAGLSVRAYDTSQNKSSRYAIAGGAAFLTLLIALGGNLELQGRAFSIKSSMLEGADLGIISVLMIVIAGAVLLLPKIKSIRPIIAGLAVVASTIWLIPMLQKILPSIMPGLTLDSIEGALHLQNGLLLWVMGTGVGFAVYGLAEDRRCASLPIVAFGVCAFGALGFGVMTSNFDGTAFRDWAQSPALLWVLLATTTAVAITGRKSLPDAPVFQELLTGIITGTIGGLICALLGNIIYSSLPFTPVVLGTVTGLMVIASSGNKTTRAAPLIAAGSTLLGICLGTTMLTPQWSPLSSQLNGSALTWLAGGTICAAFIGCLGTLREMLSQVEIELARTKGRSTDSIDPDIDEQSETPDNEVAEGIERKSLGKESQPTVVLGIELVFISIGTALVGALGWIWLAKTTGQSVLFMAWPLGALTGIAVARKSANLPAMIGPILGVVATLAGCAMVQTLGGPVVFSKDCLQWLLLGVGTAGVMSKVFEDSPPAIGRAAVVAGTAAIGAGLAWAGLAIAMNEPGMFSGNLIIQMNLPSPLTFGPWIIGAVAGLVVAGFMREAPGWQSTLLAVAIGLAGIATGLAAMGEYGGMPINALAHSFSSWNQLEHQSIALLVMVGMGVFTAGALPRLLARNEEGSQAGWAVAMVATVGFLVPNVLHARAQSVATIPVLYGSMVEILDNLKQKTKPSDYMLSWWDYGTAGWFHSEANVICHPGDQSDDVFVVAKIFNETNQTTAANLALMAVDSYAEKGPAVNGPLAIYHILKDPVSDEDMDELDDWTKLPSVAEVGPKGIFREMGRPDFQLPKSKDKRDVYLYLPDNLLRILHPIRTFSNRDLLDAEPEYRIGLKRLDESNDKAKPQAMIQELQLTAMEWFQQAAEKGHVEAQIQMANLHLRIYESGLRNIKIQKMMPDFENVKARARQGEKQSLQRLAVLWLRQHEQGQGQSALEALTWISRAIAAIKRDPNAAISKKQPTEQDAFRNHDAQSIMKKAESLQAEISIYLHGLPLVEKKSLSPKQQSLLPQMKSLLPQVRMSSILYEPRQRQHPVPSFQTFRTHTIGLPTHDNRPQAILLNNRYLAVRQDMHIYERSSTPTPKTGQKWAVRVIEGNVLRIYSGTYNGESKGPKGQNHIKLITAATPTSPAKHIGIPKVAIREWFGQWLNLDGFVVTSTDPTKPAQINRQESFYNPKERAATGMYLVVPMDLLDPPGTAVPKDYQPICLMNKALYDTTLIQLLVLAKYDENLFELVYMNHEGKLYRVKRPEERRP